METVALLCGLWACVGALRSLAPPPPHRVVQTSAGAARGYLAPRPPHYAFLGLPYARPPAGRARFKGPEPPAKWSGVLEATYRVRCAQPGRRADAACLVLNVFAPEHAAALPVLVHLHDGLFATGWGSHSAPSRLLRQGLVVVTVNYRLGAEGFLCLGTSAAPGNAGLKDQVSALAWVHTNIDKFGGDPSQVTLYGTGAGAAAAELLLLSGAVDDFIQRVILESGSSLAPTSLTYDPAATALDVAKSLGYEDDETKMTDDLTSFYQHIAIEKTLNFSDRFTPCIEDVAEYYSALLIKDPKEILQSGILKSVPLLIAYSKERSFLNNDKFHNLPNNFEELLPNNLEFENVDIKFKIGEQVKESYFGDLDSGADMVESYESYINDVFTVYPIVKSATMHAAASSSPVYLLEYTPQNGGDTIFEYIFGKKVYSKEEELVAEKFAILWSNFVKYSDPTPLESSLLPEMWLPVTFRIRNEKPDISTALCLIFHLDQMSMGAPSSGDTLSIWDHIYDNFYKSHTPPLEVSESEAISYEEESAFVSMLSNQGSKSDENNNEDGNEGNNHAGSNDKDYDVEGNDGQGKNEENDERGQNDGQAKYEEKNEGGENDGQGKNEENYEGGENAGHGEYKENNEGGDNDEQGKNEENNEGRENYEEGNDKESDGEVDNEGQTDIDEEPSS